MSECVTVIIAAFNAQNTLSRAIGSALEQLETAEVIVVDDASDDNTVQIARDAAEQDPRVRLIRQTANSGPAEARNRALDVATSEFIAVLDSDDAFLPGRLGLLLSCKDSEIVADNIAFVTQVHLDSAVEANWPGVSSAFAPLELSDFVLGNLRQKHTARGELGFLKPLLSRRFLNTHQLQYDPRLRLGEDYDLYVRMMLAGARMSLTRKPGYAAVVREKSLSAQHGTAELGALQIALQAHLAAAGLSLELKQAMQMHLREVRLKHDHRTCLNLRRQNGNRAAVRFLFDHPDRAWPVARQILRDKLNLNQPAAKAAPNEGLRLLLPVDGF